jgi:alpha-soluble NSF attachment protein
MADEQSKVDAAAAEAVDMRSNRLRYHKNRAKKAILKAEATLNQKMITNGFFLKFETAALLYYQASISFKACSKWRDAGDSLHRCAQLHHLRLKAIPEAAMLYSEAAEVYEKVDQNDAIKNYKLAVSSYCDLGIFAIAGRLQRRLSEIHFDLRHWEEAGDGFRKAADFLNSHPEQSDYCLEKSAICLIHCEEYQAAHDLYVIVAESCVQTNLRYLNTRQKLFRASLCLLALPIEPDDTNGENKYANVKVALSEFERIDCMWRCCRETKFLRNIIEAREAYNQDSFADQVYYWHTACRLNKIDIDLLRVVSNEIQEYLDNRERQRQEEAREKNRYAKKKLQLDKRRKALVERGLDPDSISMADIEDSDEEDGAVAEAGSVDGGKSEGSDEDDDDDEEEEEDESDDNSEIDLPDELKVVVTPPKERRKREKK